MISGEKVYLRALQESDAEKTLVWRNQMETKLSACTHPFPITKIIEEEWFSLVLRDRNRKSVYFAICLQSDDSLIGYIFLDQLDWVNRHCFWGAVIGEKENRGRGYGSEAVKLVLQYAFRNLNMRKVYAHVLSAHHALQTWLRMGAQIEGVLKEHVWQISKYEDMSILVWYSELFAGTI